MAKKTLEEHSPEELKAAIKTLSTTMYIMMGLMAAFVGYLLFKLFDGSLEGRHVTAMMPVGLLLIFFSLIYSRRAAAQKELDSREETA